MTKKLKLVMATNNAGKLREARAIAGDRLEILGLHDIGYSTDIEETAESLEGNALIKVRAIKDATGLDCFADDTGLLVDALDGAPGVHTARYAGDECNPDANIDLLLRNLQGVSDRSARFKTCVALSLDGKEHIFEGSVKGRIATERSGSHGFGYDPVFIPEETGVCFAEMTDDDKNAISHRGRAISAMMKWLGTLCIGIIAVFQANAASSSDWRLYNTFDDAIENVFDTPDKTYYLVRAQYYNAKTTDNDKKLLFLFCRDKQSGEIRPYNALNFLSASLIRNAYYNAARNYLLLVYEDGAIDLLDDNGKAKTIYGLQKYSSATTKEVRGISFDPENNRAYLATDFGFISIDDIKGEIAISGIFNTPVDKVARTGSRLVIMRDGKLYCADASARSFTLADFTQPEWAPQGTVKDMYTLSDTKLLVMTSLDNQAKDYVVTIPKTGGEPAVESIGNLQGGYISENKDGLFIARYDLFISLDRSNGATRSIRRRQEESQLPAASWDNQVFQIGHPRKGFYSVKLNSDDSWTALGEAARPDSPAAFRSDALMYTPQHGLLVNTHGLSQFFVSRNAVNPILLSGLKDGAWNMHGLPYLDPDHGNRLINPTGFVQDPDNKDVFYFGSVINGLLRYNIKDGSDLLHLTKSDDSPSYPGHVSIQDPYKSWNLFPLTNPKFDTKGNLIVAHINTEVEDNYFTEIWIWPADDRRASTSPETFRPFIKLKVDDIKIVTTNLALPLKSQGCQDMIVYIPLNRYGSPFAVYDHNGTLNETSDDRQATMTDLQDNDGTLSVNYYYCAVEDPDTGLVWVGTDNGVFTFNPKEAFSNPGHVSRIKVSRNDGTSLADYLLAETSVNHIAIDGQGRKWFSLSGGGLVCTSPDGKTIIQEIDTDNSMLPSDLVYASCYNPDRNSMMIGTSAGLCEYYLSGQANEGGNSEVRAYPNPVRHDYYGWVTIDGLEEDCIVKITDSAGNIVRELGPAVAGKVQWDVCGMDLNRVPSGVYFVLASSGPGTGSYSEATKILVINR